MPSVNYLDTCCVLMFIDRGDRLRKSFEIGSVNIERRLKSNMGDFCIPMPAFGEALCKVLEHKDDPEGTFSELKRLVDAHVLHIRYLDSPAAFGLAYNLCREQHFRRDTVSIMDGLILASAVSDMECTRFYTTDTTLLTSAHAAAVIDDYRSAQDWPELKIREVDFLTS